MATTQNTFTGNGSNLGPFSFTFKWLEPTDIKVTVAGVLKTVGTHYNLQSLNYSTKTGGQVLFTAGNAPANGAAIVIYRQTDDTDLAATFSSGSAIRAQDLNSNFIQGLYVAQEVNNSVVTANTTANTALTNSNTAISTANTASTNASAAVATANTASANASAAVSTANTASANATTAVNTANSAAAAVANVVSYPIIANVAAIPATPANNTAVEVTNSTGIQSFTPLSGVPVGFVGSAGLSVRIIYSTVGSTWNWVQYFPNDPEARYLKLAGGNITGNLGIGNPTPAYALDVASSVAQVGNSTDAFIQYKSTAGNWHVGANNSNAYAFYSGTYGSGTERVRIDSSGRLLVGTSAGRTLAGVNANLQIEGSGSNYDTSALNITRNTDTDPLNGPSFCFGRTRGTVNGAVTAVINGDRLGSIGFAGANGTNLSNLGGIIECYVDGVVTGGGAGDMPGRLVFSTTADGASLPTERMRINSNGYAKFANDGSPTNSSLSFSSFDQSINDATLYLNAKNASYTTSVLAGYAERAASSAYNLAAFHSTHVPGSSADVEFRLRGDGEAFADGSWTGGGADYAEYFEWSDSNPKNEDRRGISVVLDGDKIREASAGEDPIGVISGNPSVVGDAAWNKWHDKHLRDDFGTYIQEDYEVEDEDGTTVVQQRRKLNPAYDPDVEYISREQRPEWDCVGLMGKLRIRKGQITGSRWIKMRDISDSVEEWLVR